MKLPDHKIELTNGWTALFRSRGEFRMGCEGWDLILSNQAGSTFNHFDKKPVLINDYDGVNAVKAIQVAEDPKYIVLNCDDDSRWIINLEDQSIAPLLFRIHHNVKGKYVSALEQPCYKQIQEYVQLPEELIYITFPLTPIDEFESIFKEYLALRRAQLEQTYFA